MKTPVRLARGRVQYTGRIARASYAAWAETVEGRKALARVASRIRFALFGRLRAARRRVWRQLVQAARAESVVVALQRHIDEFLHLDTLACADLPRGIVDLRRLVVVPRLFVNRDAYERICATLHADSRFAQIEGGESLRCWFAMRTIEGVEAAIARAAPSPRRPLPAGTSWVVVGVNEQFDWHKLLDSPPWPGHYHVLELRPASPMTRKVRHATRDALAAIETSLLRMSRKHRYDAVALARVSLERLVNS
jgi:hypothetical protein